MAGQSRVGKGKPLQPIRLGACILLGISTVSVGTAMVFDRPRRPDLRCMLLLLALPGLAFFVFVLAAIFFVRGDRNNSFYTLYNFQTIFRLTRLVRQ